MNHHDFFSDFFGGASGLLSSAEAMLQQALTPRRCVVLELNYNCSFFLTFIFDKIYLND